MTTPRIHPRGKPADDIQRTTELPPAPKPRTRKRRDNLPRLESYDNVLEINRGGMGAILSAIDPGTEREVALKVLQQEIANPRNVRRFLAEGKVTAQLEHPNIVPVHEVGRSEDGQHYFSMKMVRGEDLETVLSRRRRTWSLRRLLSVFMKACDAVAFAHSRGVIHRDLKPENVMIGTFGEVLVMDWGVAKLKSQSDDEHREGLAEPGKVLEAGTIAGTIMGTPAYMPPEQAGGEVEKIDERSDIYALGAILYQILTNEIPVEGSSVWDTLRRASDNEVIPPSERCPGRQIPRELEAVVMKAMARTRSRRYRSVPELQADIEAYLEGRILRAARYTPWQRLRKWIARHRALTVSVISILVGLAAITTVFELRNAHERAAQVEHAVGTAREILRDIPEVDELQQRNGPVRHRLAQDGVAKCLQAISFLDRALILEPEDLEVWELRRRTTVSLGYLALAGQDYTLANHAFGDLAHCNVPQAEVDALVAMVEKARTGVLEARKARLTDIMNRIREDRLQDGWTIEDYVYQAVGFRDQQTVHLLCKALGPMTDKATKDGARAQWSNAERQLATFICRVLGRLERPDIIGPLTPFAKTVLDEQLAVEAGLALCHSRQPEAYPVLMTMLQNLGPSSNAWRRIRPALKQIPAPPKTAAKGKDPTELVARGLMLRSHGDLDGAVRAYTRAIALDPECVAAYNNRGLVHQMRDELKAALTDFNTAIRLRPKYATSYGSRAAVLIKLEDLDGALRDYDRAIALAPTRAMTWNNRGLLRMDRNEPREAVSDLEKAIALNPTYFEAHHNLGWVYRVLGDLERSRAVLDKAVGLNPKFSNGWQNRAQTRLMAKDLTGAITDCTRAIELDGNNRKAYFTRGLARKKRKDFKGAIEDYTKSIGLDPKHAKSWCNRGNARREQGDYRRAMADFDKALGLEPRNAQFLNNKGWTLHLMGRDAEAIRAFRTAVSFDPSYWLAFSNHGRVLSKQGRFAEAVALYRKALAVAPDASKAVLRRWIKKLGG